MAYSAVEEIKSKCNIIDVIGRVVPLKKAGSHHKGICPFHNEKTPSFHVSEEKQFYYCFGCNASGDVLEFVQNYYGLDFVQAMEQLATEYGIALEDGFHKSVDREEAYNINRAAAKFFYRALRTPGNPAYTYMEKRGISAETMQKFGIGYADDSFSSLMDHLSSLGIKKEKMAELGLISSSKGKYYDKFRGRVIFPIINTRGKIVGFGGRVLGEGMPKYLNSPESFVFLKKENLYGLNLTRQEMSKADCAILVEGYMDVISLYQSGIRNVSASLGTALTEGQARLLKRTTNNVILSYDADKAGVAAALRGLDILYKEDCKVKVLHISDGKDPDDFVRKNGKQAYLKLMDQALYFADYKFSILKKEFDLESPEGRIDFLKKAVEVLQSLSPVEADIYIKKLAEDTKISQNAIRLEMNGNTRQEPPTRRNVGNRNIDEPKDGLTSQERTLLKLLLTDSSYCPRIRPYEKNAFPGDSGFALYINIKKHYREGQEILYEAWAKDLEEKEREALDDIWNNVPLVKEKQEQVFLDLIHDIKIRELRQKQQQKLNALAMADEEKDETNIRQLTTELMEIQQALEKEKEGK